MNAVEVSLEVKGRISARDIIEYCTQDVGSPALTGGWTASIFPRADRLLCTTPDNGD